MRDVEFSFEILNSMNGIWDLMDKSLAAQLLCGRIFIFIQLPHNSSAVPHFTPLRETRSIVMWTKYHITVCEAPNNCYVVTSFPSLLITKQTAQIGLEG